MLQLTHMSNDSHSITTGSRRSLRSIVRLPVLVLAMVIIGLSGYMWHAHRSAQACPIDADQVLVRIQTDKAKMQIAALKSVDEQARAQEFWSSELHNIASQMPEGRIKETARKAGEANFSPGRDTTADPNLTKLESLLAHCH